MLSTPPATISKWRCSAGISRNGSLRVVSLMSALRKRPRPRGATNDVRPESGLIEYLQPLSFSLGTVVVRAAGVLTHLGRPYFRRMPEVVLVMTRQRFLHVMHLRGSGHSPNWGASGPAELASGGGGRGMLVLFRGMFFWG